MLFAYQRVTDLVLGIGCGYPAVDLQVLAMDTLSVENWQFSFQIIGESHCVQIKHSAQPGLFEILACVPLSPADLLHYHTLQNPRHHEFNWQQYAITLSVEQVPVEIPLTLLESPQLEVRFPMEYATMKAHPALTAISWQQSAGRVQWQTIHTYPEKAHTVVVTTRSTFQINHTEQRDV